jgi:hypothetical protein
MVVGEDNLQANAKLMQITGALNSFSSGFGLRNYRQQKCRQNYDDGDDRQKLN